MLSPHFVNEAVDVQLPLLASLERGLCLDGGLDRPFSIRILYQKPKTKVYTST